MNSCQFDDYLTDYPLNEWMCSDSMKIYECFNGRFDYEKPENNALDW